MNELEVEIATDLNEVLNVERAAFASATEAELTRALLEDPGAQPSLSLTAMDNGRAVGHILFTRAELEGEHNLECRLLAPLAVLPEYQNQGVGAHLIQSSIHYLEEQGVDLIFVLGYPDYYTKFGFIPAWKFGIAAPYPIAEDKRDAWMLQSLRRGLSGNFNTRLLCCETFMRPELWQE